MRAIKDAMLWFKCHLGAKLIAIFVSFFLVITVIFTCISIHYQKSEARKELISAGRLISSVAASELKNAVYAENGNEAGRIAAGMSDRKDIRAITTYKASFEVLSHYSKEGAPPKHLTGVISRPKALLINEDDGLMEFIAPVVISVPLKSEGMYFDSKEKSSENIVAGYVSVILNREAEAHEMRSILVLNTIVAVFLSVLISFIICLIVRRALSPLSNLTLVMKSLKEGGSMEMVPVESGDEIGVLSRTFNDMMAERLKLEEQLLLSQKLETIAVFAKGMAHDFNNKIGTVKGFLFIIENSITADNVAFPYITYLNESLNRMEYLIQSLLAFSRRQALFVSDADLVDFVFSLSPSIRQTAGEKVECLFEFPEVPLQVSIDKVQIERVFDNLVWNAFDAMPEGGTLTFRLGKTYYERTALRPAGWYAMISVSDTGAGIEESIKDRIFEPFFTTKEEGHGTGLGLSIVYGIIEQHKGILTVDSEIGKGTTFSIKLPVKNCEVGEK